MSDFVVLLPVKPPARGKSRLAGLPDEQRTALATGFARDTAAVALTTTGVTAVLVVTDDVSLARALADLGCEAVPDGSAGLNETLEQAAAEARRRWPGCGVAALCADLPAITADELAQALAVVPAAGTAYVADHRGTGTTLYAAGPEGTFRPEFGHASASVHRGDGAVEIEGVLAGLRLDVDEPGDLGKALLLGVGPATTAAAGR